MSEGSTHYKPAASAALLQSIPVRRAAGLLLAACLAVACATSTKNISALPEPDATVLVLVDGYYYPAQRIGNHEIETYPPRIEVRLVGSGETLTPYVTNVVDFDGAAKTGLRAQRLTEGTWVPIGAGAADTSAYELVKNAADLSSIRFETADETGERQ